MVSPVFEISLLKVSLGEISEWLGEDVTVEMRVDHHVFLFPGKGRHFSSNQVLLFNNPSQQTLQIFLYPQSSSNTATNVVYGEVNLQPLAELQYTKHIVFVNTVLINAGVIQDSPTGTIEIAVVCVESLDAILEVKVKSAELERDTELVGRMDPYCILTLDEVKKTTTTKSEAGRTPVWDEQFSFVVSKVNSQLFIVVKDQDMTSSDIIGSVVVHLQESGMFSPLNTWHQQTLELTYDNKPAGRVILSTRFSVNTSKKHPQ